MSPCVSKSEVRGSKEPLEMRNRVVRYAGDTEAGGSEVVGRAGEPGSKTEIQCLGQNGIRTDGSLCRGVTGSPAEEGYSPQASPAVLRGNLGFYSWVSGPSTQKEAGLFRSSLSHCGVNKMYNQGSALYAALTSGKARKALNSLCPSSLHICSYTRLLLVKGTRPRSR